MVKAFLVPYTNTICIMDKGQPCVVLVKMEIDEGKMLSTLQFTMGIKRKEHLSLPHSSSTRRLRKFKHLRPSK